MDMMARIRMAWFFLGGLVLIPVMPIHAEIGTGRFVLMPEITLQETYRTNIYLTESARDSDFITTVTPRIRMRYSFGTNSISLGYQAGFHNFANHPGNNYQDHKAKGLIQLSTPGGLRFELEDNFINSTLERSGAIERQRDFNQNALNGTLSYSLNDRWKLDVKYTRDDLAFRSSQDRSSEYGCNLLGSSLYYRIFPRASALIEYDLLTKNFENSGTSDHRDHLFYGGIAFDPKGKLKGSLRAGYGQKRFDSELAGRNNSPNTWILAVDLIEDFSTRTSMAFDAIREMADDTDYRNASYVNTHAALSFQHFFTQKIGASGRIGYRHAVYLDKLNEPVTNVLKKRWDAEWSIGAAGIYKVQKWLTASMEYRYTDRKSNFNLYSYTDHRVLFSVVVTP